MSETSPIAIVTGGGSGIGLGIAQKFVKAGIRTIIVGRDEVKLNAALSEIGDGAYARACDLSDLSSIPPFIANLVKEFGQIDILVNNAGINMKKDFVEVTDEDFQKVKINKTADAEVELEGEIAATDFGSFWPKAIKTLGEKAKIDGFRPGHIPEKVLVEQLGENGVLYEMANQALGQAYAQILTENKIDAIGEPQITITKIAKDNPLGFKIKTAVLPKIDLGDYKKIAQKVNGKPLEETVISDEEVNKVIEDLRQQRAAANQTKHEHKEGEKCDHDEPKLPELNDDFAKSLGQFKNLDDLRAKIKENMELEKKARAKDKRRLEIVEAIRNQAKLEIPKLLIDTEKEKMMAEMEHQISQMGLNFDDYLKHLKKTREELSAGWNDDAQKRVSFSLIVNEIARLEKVTPPADDLKNETDFLAERYKDVDRRRLEAYAANVITNEKVLQMLEEQK